MVALVAVFALLVQVLAPAFAAAGPLPDGAGVICTDMGLGKAPGEPASPPSEHHCKHCVCPPLSADPPALVSIGRVAYFEAAEPAARLWRALPPPARAPPRPPGQGPPDPNA